MKYIMFLALSLITSVSAFAQESTQKTFWDDPVNHPMAPLYTVSVFLFVVLTLVVVVVFKLLSAINILVEQSEKEKAKKSGIAYIPRPTFWSRFSNVVNDAVPVEHEKDIDMGHSYDGIRELDNHLPPWWKWLFIGTIGWAAIYFFVFHISSSLPLSIEEYQNEVAAADLEKQKLLASQPQSLIDVEKLEYNADAEIIGKGKQIFLSNCVACHKNDGGGNTIGPNLTDTYWLHGGGIKNVFTTINGGFVEKGMPAWGKALSQKEVRDVAFFVMSLQGTNPPNAKAPQGELFVKPVEQTDSLKAQASL